jgi:alpha-ketoglutarate-dependent taurine dioxygenase
MAAAPARVSTAMIEALAWFDALVESAVPPIELALAAGQAIFVNNQRVLHARSDYRDPERHLLRVRMHAVPR